MPKASSVQGVELQGASGVLMWTEFDVIEQDALPSLAVLRRQSIPN